MTQQEAIPENLKQIALMARSRRTRTSAFTKERPTDWNPQNVMRDDIGLAYTDDSAWNKLADLILAGHPVEALKLDKPVGATAYVLKWAEGTQMVYAKLQPVGRKVLGRSFHISTIQDSK